MKAYPECVPCVVRQGLNAAERLNLPKEKLFEVVREGVRFMARFETYDRSPAYYAYHVQQIVKRITGERDPFRELKKLANRKAEEILSSLNLDEILNSGERLRNALKLSAVGNLLDFAILPVEEAFKKLFEFLKKDFAVDDYGTFKRELASSGRILILGDNAGEIVFDKVLVRELKALGKEVVYAVKGGPILNDATLEDAKEVSMTSLCKVIDNGNDRVGTVLKYASEEFLKEWRAADLILSKGQANFESLSEYDEKPIYFLLTAKCKPVAEEVGARKPGDLVFKRNPAPPRA
ncbi:MAG: DUF89 domain-containing protein [Aquificae bacterium]|nr:DUF89 domain-containing protein [Aquificota bacterium]